MSPTKVFISIFAAGIVLAVILGSIGLYQSNNNVADGNNSNGDVVLTGEELVAQNCLNCHGGQELQGSLGPALVNAGLTAEDIINALVEGPGSMPSYSNQMTEEQMQDIADYLIGRGQ